MDDKIITNPVKAIRAQCKQCMGGGNPFKEIEECKAEKTCAVWPFRFGKNPYRKKVTQSEEQIAATTERFRIAREKKAE